MREDDIERLFTRHGKVRDVKIIYDIGTNKPKGNSLQKITF